MSCGSVDSFECGNGDCINYSLTCDGMAHCKDKSDEKQSYCGEFLWSNNHRTSQRERIHAVFHCGVSVIFAYLEYNQLNLHLHS